MDGNNIQRLRPLHMFFEVVDTSDGVVTRFAKLD